MPQMGASALRYQKIAHAIDHRKRTGNNGNHGNKSLAIDFDPEKPIASGDITMGD